MSRQKKTRKKKYLRKRLSKLPSSEQNSYADTRTEYSSFLASKSKPRDCHCFIICFLDHNPCNSYSCGWLCSQGQTCESKEPCAGHEAPFPERIMNACCANDTAEFNALVEETKAITFNNEMKNDLAKGLLVSTMYHHNYKMFEQVVSNFSYVLKDARSAFRLCFLFLWESRFQSYNCNWGSKDWSMYTHLRGDTSVRFLLKWSNVFVNSKHGSHYYCATPVDDKIVNWVEVCAKNGADFTECACSARKDTIACKSRNIPTDAWKRGVQFMFEFVTSMLTFDIPRDVSGIIMEFACTNICWKGFIKKDPSIPCGPISGRLGRSNFLANISD